MRMTTKKNPSASRLRILFVLENYLPHIGGVEIVFKNLCEGLAARGHDVTVITHHIPGTKLRETMNGVKVERVRCFDSRYLFTFAAMPAVLRLAKTADVIHTTTFNGAPPAWLGARLRGKPVIITVHETWMKKWKEYSDFPAWKAWLHEMLERAVFLPSYNRYACVSQSTARQLALAIPKRKENVITIHNGFDPTQWSKRREWEPYRRKLKLERRFLIFAYGRPGTSKGFTYLVDAFPIVKKRIPNATLLLMLSEDKQYRHVLEGFKREAPPDVIFLKPQPYSEIPYYTQMADCVVVPSITEGFGYVVLESCASGTPVVATDTTSIPEVIHGKHLLVKPKSAKALADGIIKVKSGKWETTPEKRFPWSASITSYENEYRRLMKNFLGDDGRKRKRGAVK